MRAGSVPTAMIKESKLKPSDMPEAKTWRDIDPELCGRLIFFKKICPECWLKSKTSALFVVSTKKIGILSCLNCPFDTEDINKNKERFYEWDI